MLTSIFRSQVRPALAVARAHVHCPRYVASNVSRSHLISALVLTKRLVSSSRSVRDDVDLLYNRPEGPPCEALYVWNLPYEVEKNDLLEIFSRFGRVRQVRIPSKFQDQPAMFAHIEFDTKEEATEARRSARENPIFVKDRHMLVNFAFRRNYDRAYSIEPSKVLFFGGFRGQQWELRRLLKPWVKNVVRVHFAMDKRTRQETGSGFIHFNNTQNAIQAMNELRSHEFPRHGTLYFNFATNGERRDKYT